MSRAHLSLDKVLALHRPPTSYHHRTRSQDSASLIHQYVWYQSHQSYHPSLGWKTRSRPRAVRRQYWGWGSDVLRISQWCRWLRPQFPDTALQPSTCSCFRWVNLLGQRMALSRSEFRRSFNASVCRTVRRSPPNKESVPGNWFACGQQTGSGERSPIFSVILGAISAQCMTIWMCDPLIIINWWAC